MLIMIPVHKLDDKIYQIELTEYETKKIITLDYTNKTTVLDIKNKIYLKHPEFKDFSIFEDETEVDIDKYPILDYSRNLESLKKKSINAKFILKDKNKIKIGKVINFFDESENTLNSKKKFFCDFKIFFSKIEKKKKRIFSEIEFFEFKQKNQEVKKFNFLVLYNLIGTQLLEEGNIDRTIEILAKEKRKLYKKKINFVFDLKKKNKIFKKEEIEKIEKKNLEKEIKNKEIHLISEAFFYKQKKQIDELPLNKEINKVDKKIYEKIKIYNKKYPDIKTYYLFHNYVDTNR
jgi:hypothetical protein